ncbi:MAG: hypothetical protein Q8P18_11305 [Pseudomonadota bacterium]|nr:hypothetical protein [Pseudomonadota bacterium]
MRYAPTQVDHHALQAHPATWLGACFADLVGPAYGRVEHVHP